MKWGAIQWFAHRLRVRVLRALGRSTSADFLEQVERAELAQFAYTRSLEIAREGAERKRRTEGGK